MGLYRWEELPRWITQSSEAAVTLSEKERQARPISSALESTS
jgi:hypothetical protein